MAGYIHVLDSETIDKIAAGEVVEKPASVVKELVENSIDAGADKITVEIKEGGISLIRVTDNGCGIAKDDLKHAFMRHATSKITSIDDLDNIVSLGFRGEALSSISAVAQVEMITKQKDELLGTRVCCNGGLMEAPEEVGAPDGTTIIVRNLFYNTPVRRKFLHTSMTEGAYVAELMQHIAMSHPDVSVSYIQNGQTRFFTSGNGELSEIIYRIYGKDVSEQMIPIDCEKNGVQVTGFIGKPMLARANRNYETFFVNGRYIKSKIISMAVEEGYKSFLMQHKYPFAVLHFHISGKDIDVNVHPTKMEIRIMNPQPFCEFIKKLVSESLSDQVLIPEVKESELPSEQEKENRATAEPKGRPAPTVQRELPPEPFETKRTSQIPDEQNFTEVVQAQVRVDNIVPQQTEQIVPQRTEPQEQSVVPRMVREEIPKGFKIIGNPLPKTHTQHQPKENIIKHDDAVISKAVQMELFSANLEKPDENRLKGLAIIGQVFQTYWIVEFENKLYFVDQHAAHEKVNYENWMKKLREKENTTQMLMPPIILSLNVREMNVLREFENSFTDLGFEFETFGGDEIALRGIPQDLYGADARQLFLDILDELSDSPVRGTPDIITSKLASMSCKAAVKGNQSLSFEEAKALLEQLFSLENPYHCPHGRPTMFSMSKYEMEKKFKRII